MKKLLLIPIFLLSCNKSKQPLIKSESIKIDSCSNWKGVWVCINTDTIINDSLFININYYAIKNNKQYVQYKSNIKQFDSLLWHYCPIQKELNDDNIHIIYNKKHLYFRYYH